MITGLRRSGRTTRMAKAAIEDAKVGKRVILVAANEAMMAHLDTVLRKQLYLSRIEAVRQFSRVRPIMYTIPKGGAISITMPVRDGFRLSHPELPIEHGAAEVVRIDHFTIEDYLTRTNRFLVEEMDRYASDIESTVGIYRMQKVNTLAIQALEWITMTNATESEYVGRAEWALRATKEEMAKV